VSEGAFPVPANVDRLQRAAFVAGAAGLLLSLLGAVFDLAQFLRSWLFAHLFWTGVSIGCLSLLMLNHLTGGVWGAVIRRLVEAGARVLPVLALLFLPIAFGVPRIYEWARPDAMADPVLRMKQPYLNVPFFLVRAVFYFGAWSLLAHLLSRWSAELDRGGSLRVARRLRGLSGGGLVLLGFTITFSAVDWAMSLDPHWYSTIYGMIFMVNQTLSAMALVIVLLARFRDESPFAGMVRPEAFHDLGKLLLAFVMFWCYVAFAQYLIIWAGNLPEEIPWYLRRLSGGWGWIGAALVLFHFALPFLLLLPEGANRNSRILAGVAALVVLMRFVDVYWLVRPVFTQATAAAASTRFQVHWLDLAAPIGIGGVWLAFFLWQLEERPLLPSQDPEFLEALAHADH
jgi:hypothetical protein